MRICLYYFSGTGNTQAVASLFASEFGDESVVYRIAYPFTAVPNPNDFDLIGIGYPIHAFNTPEVLLQFAKRLPRADHQPFFIFKDSGEPIAMNNASSMSLIHLLKTKGYHCVQEFHYLMPYNIVFRHSEGMAKKMWLTAKAMVHYNAQKLQSGIEEPPKKHPFIFALILPFRIEWPFAKSNGRHFKVDSSKCVKCLRCVRSCPMQNITFKDGEFHFSSHCALCLNCSFLCPTKALTPGIFSHHWFLNGSYHLRELEDNPDVLVSKENHEKLYNHAYDRYFARCEKLLQTK